MEHKFVVTIETDLLDRGAYSFLSRAVGIYSGTNLPFKNTDISYARQDKGSAEQQTNNSDSKKLPADIVEKFHNIIRDRCSRMWSSEREVMDIVADFISR